jgi:hypothetical protein
MRQGKGPGGMDGNAAGPGAARRARGASAETVEVRA